MGVNSVLSVGRVDIIELSPLNRHVDYVSV